MLVVFGALVALAVGDASARLARPAAVAGGTLRIAGPTDTSPGDPALARPITYALWYATCAPLMMFADSPGAKGLQARPEAAARPPQISRDGRTYVFTIRKGLRFSDGSPLTAANYAVELRRALNPSMQSGGAALFSDVKRVVVAGPSLRITLRRPSGDLATRLAMPFACPVPVGLPVDPAGVDPKRGSGPYYVARRAGNTVVLERNRYYHGRRPHRVDRIVATIVGDLDDSIRAVESGDADVLGIEVPGDVRDVLAQRYGVNKQQFFRLLGRGTGALVLNTSRPLFRNNVALRKAVNLAVDRAEVLRRTHVSSIWLRPTDQVIPSGFPGWRDYRIYPLDGPDVARARKLAEGNLRGGKAILYAATGAARLDQAQVVLRNLHEIGLDVTVKPISVEALNVKAGIPGEPYDLILADFPITYPDPADILRRDLGGENARKPWGNENFAYFDNSTYNRRLAAANRLIGAARFRAFSRLDAEIMRKQAPWAPLFETTNTLLLSKRVACLKVHPVYIRDYAAMCVR
jgi:peptide/nickel transport system substrate-binding protein